jgi:hypothetical protein
MKSIARVSLVTATAAALWLAPPAARAQHPRQPVIPVDRGGVTPPPVLPDPTGIYEGSVRFTVDGGSPVTQPWRVVLKARPCPDCAPGQYWVSGTSFDGISYSGGSEERGSVDAIVDVDGTALDFRLVTINCVFINGDIVAPPQTALRGGGFGAQPGPSMTIRDGKIDGTLSGTDCFGRDIVGSASLTRTSTNPGQICGLAPRWYQLTFNDSRGRSVQGPVYVAAANCDLALRIPDVELNVEILLANASSGSLSMSGLGDCGTQGSGTISRKPNGSITATYNGGILTGCTVSPGSVSGTFTLDPL